MTEVEVHEWRCWGWQTDQMKEAQEKDPELQLIVSYLRNQATPKESELALSSAERKDYWVRKEE